MFWGKLGVVTIGAAAILLVASSVNAAPRQSGAATSNAGERAVVASAVPIPEGLLKAKRVFLGFAGVDGTAAPVFEKLSGEYHPYNLIYTALKNWGRYELVSSPAEAELVFEVSFIAPLIGTQHLDSYGPQFRLSIFDAKTHFALWNITESVNGAFRKATFEKNIHSSATRIVDDLKGLTEKTQTTASKN